MELTPEQRQFIVGLSPEQRAELVSRLNARSSRHEIGLGDAVKKFLHAIGIDHPCGGCEQRRQLLNKFMKIRY